MSLEIEIHAEPHEGKRISLAGSLDTDTAPKLQEKIDQEIDSIATIEFRAAVDDGYGLLGVESEAFTSEFERKALRIGRLE